MSENIALILFAILLHYMLENSVKFADYSCPIYCKVEHKHITQEVINEVRELNNRVLIQRREQEEDSIRVEQER